MSADRPQWPMWVRFGTWGDAGLRDLGMPVHVDGLTLRRVRPNDFDDMLEYRSDPDVARYQLHGPGTPEELRAEIEQQVAVEAGAEGVPLTLVVEFEGRVIGECQLTIGSRERRQGVLGYQFNPRFTGRGFATRAVAITLGIGFQQLGLHRIVAETDVRNERSWRLLERLGLRREAHFLHDQFVNEEWVDSYLYALLEHEWPASRGEAASR